MAIWKALREKEQTNKKIQLNNHRRENEDKLSEEERHEQTGHQTKPTAQDKQDAFGQIRIQSIVTLYNDYYTEQFKNPRANSILHM